MENVLSKGYIAGADLSDYQYCFVYMTAENTVTYCGAGGTPIGILQNNPESGEIANVMHIGISRLSMSATCSVMDKIGCAASGQGVAMTDDDEIYGAIAIDEASNANERIKVLLPGGFFTISGSGDDA